MKFGGNALAAAFLMMSWALLGGALLAARLRGRRAAVVSAPGASAVPVDAPAPRRDLQSWGGLALQGVGFALVWGVKPGSGSFWSGASPLALTWFSLSGGMFALLSSAFGVLAVRELGKQWSLTARTLANHELITSGPFGRVRHPIYSALLGMLLGTGLVLSTASATALGALVYLLGTHWRATREEALLRAHFGAAYEDYARRVPRLIPRPWR
ncbi:MAG: isoprenylcysteine carboxylmethyltransferase family protein [Arenimonas sp.]